MDLNIRGPADTKLGYGHCSIQILVEFMNRGHNVSFFNVNTNGHADISNHSDVDVLKQAIKNCQKFSYDAPSLLIWHENSLGVHPGKGKKTALTFFEMDTLDDTRIHNLNFLDHLFVASSWAEQICLHSGVKVPISVVPMGVNRTVFDHTKSNSHEFTATRFLNIGKIERRKGHDILIEAFNKAFKPSDDVELIMFWENPFMSEEEKKPWYDLYLNTDMGPKVKIQSSYVSTDAELAAFINCVDCCVFPTRAEGFGLPILQSLSCGKRVITTDYSAHTEFCNKDNCRLIHITELEDAYDDKWFFGQGRWAHLNMSHIDLIAEEMRQVHIDKIACKPLVNLPGVETAKKFSWTNTVDGLIEGLL